MSIFETPTWDVNKASNKLNKELFGPKLKKKQQKLRESSSLQYGPEKAIQRQESEPTLNRRKRKKFKKANIKKNIISPKQQEFSDELKQPAKGKHKKEKQTISPINSFKQNNGGEVGFSALTKGQKKKLREARRKLENKSSDEVSFPNVAKNSDNLGLHVEKKKKKKKRLKVSSESSLDTSKLFNSDAQQSVSNPGLKSKLSKSMKRKLKKQFLQRNIASVTNPENFQASDSHASSGMKKRKKRYSKESLLNQEPVSFEKHFKSKENVAGKHIPGQFVKIMSVESNNTGPGGPVKKKKKKKQRKQLHISDISMLSAVGNSAESCPVISGNKMSNLSNKKKRKAGNDISQVIDESSQKNKKPKLSDDVVDEHKKSRKRKKKRKHSSDADPENEGPKVKHKKHNLDDSFHDDSDVSDSPPDLATKKHDCKGGNLPSYKGGNTTSSPHFIHKLKQIVQIQHNTSEKKKDGQSLTLRERMLKQLQAARFRFLNEQLYSCEGKDALKLFRSDPDSFKAYHIGYQQQVAQWPLNPLDKIINSIKKKSKDLVIADFGCGDARLAKSVRNKVHSFDLVALSDDVTACDMGHTYLRDASVDIAVFCLSLMGTNLNKYLLEANRVLKEGGQLKIAEVESRFENVDKFIKDLISFGFENTGKDLTQNLFYFMDFKKRNSVIFNNKLPQLSLKPCLYKKR